MNTDKKNNPNLHLSIFVILVLASGWLGVLLDSLLTEQPEGNSLGMGLWLILPFLTSLLLRTIGRDWKDIGIKLNLKGNVKWYVVSLSIYPLVTIITVSLALLLGVSNLAHFEISSLFPLIFVSIISNFIKNIFEEFTWRGYLTPKLIERKVNDWLIYLISGLIWALWHAAYYLVFLPNQYFESVSRLDMLLSGCIFMVSWTVMYVEIYRITKSVWPCVLMHAVEDAVPTVLVTITGIITFTKSGDFWLNPISGVIATILFLGIGLLLRSIRITKERELNSKEKQSFTI
ncbi:MULTISPECIES: CPBP family glutamic-type intramembrane protease [Bacillus cereus group]|uniref:CPBP family intramembrane metalloprotease n=1 Tax=Bacillus cereus TaxID=1396 RepID=A0AA44QAW4_BACCE|nr:MULTISPECIES: type II CAAX endopeptidase family protein [Bacillus cereus group]EEL50315.1 CAAX amino terminal protease [Bacillus cereus Rock3-44]PFA17731.1 CPBP family intramembrane metalloprotease [Bacillus cereus]PFN07275.1 CPBP family intramembrane metalloprotease [Bacillus cereus]PFO78042.1 CPBP family intramembrane metalloprotease [Bacillus cereus]PFR27444.1 CPBP family intramembrane metalloprotease [Bacillus cereus]